MKQVTLAKEVRLGGIGLHSGEQAEVVLRPGKAGAGVVFVAGGEEIPARPGLVRAMPLCTLLDWRDFKLSTVEHLLAALHGLGVDAVRIEVDGPEVPVLDGSALPWVEAIDAAGRVELEAPRAWLQVEKALEIKDGLKVLRALPETAPEEGRLDVRVAVDYPHPLIGSQTWHGVVDEEVFRKQIAPARTFVLEREINAAREAGLIKGGSLENAVVFGDDGTVKNPEGLRFADEPVRHKVLDALGDFYMAGRMVWGRLDLTLPGHAMNNRLLRAMVEN